MMWSDGSWGWWGLGLIMMIVCAVMMMRMMGGMMMGHGHGSHGSTGDGTRGRRPADAERILAERLARGEIGVEDYERRLAAIRETTEADQAT